MNNEEFRKNPRAHCHGTSKPVAHACLGGFAQLLAAKAGRSVRTGPRDQEKRGRSFGFAQDDRGVTGNRETLMLYLVGGNQCIARFFEVWTRFIECQTAIMKCFREWLADIA